MISPEVMAITYGIGSALTWGAGDFSGGFASKQGGTLTIIFYAQIIGLLMLIGLHALFSGSPLTSMTLLVMPHFLWGGLAGICGVLGLIALYKGLAQGRMGVVAPVSAVVTALVPVVLAISTEGLPKNTQLIGFALALSAVWCFSATKGLSSVLRNELTLSVLAGLGFGLFFICIDHVSSQAILWPLISARLTSITLIGAMLMARRQMTLPPRRQLPYIVLAGILDIAGNAFFALASKLGRLDVSAILASMYPVSTVLLARFFLKERLQRQQRLGVLAACVALILIAV